MLYLSCPAKGSGKTFLAALVWCLAFTANFIRAQEFQVLDARIDTDGRVHLRYLADTNSYYILYRGDTVASVSTASALALGIDGIADLAEPAPVSSSAAFYRVRRVPVLAPLDLDQDGIDDVYELNHAPLLSPLNATDAGLPDGNGKTQLEAYLIATTPLTTVRETSPLPG